MVCDDMYFMQKNSSDGTFLAHASLFIAVLVLSTR